MFYLLIYVFTAMDSVIVTTRLVPHAVLEVEGERDRRKLTARERESQRARDRQTPTQRDR